MTEEEIKRLLELIQGQQLSGLLGNPQGGLLAQQQFGGLLGGPRPRTGTTSVGIRG